MLCFPHPSFLYRPLWSQNPLLQVWAFVAKKPKPARCTPSRIWLAESPLTQVSNPSPWQKPTKINLNLLKHILLKTVFYPAGCFFVGNGALQLLDFPQLQNNANDCDDGGRKWRQWAHAHVGGCRRGWMKSVAPPAEPVSAQTSTATPSSASTKLHLRLASLEIYHRQWSALAWQALAWAPCAPRHARAGPALGPGGWLANCRPPATSAGPPATSTRLHVRAANSTTHMNGDHPLRLAEWMKPIPTRPPSVCEGGKADCPP